jgi:hypothetical protein
MMKRFKIGLVTLALSLVGSSAFGLSLAAASPATVASLKTSACGGLNQLDSSTKEDCSNLDTGSSGIESVVRGIVNILSIIVGVAAVIVVIISGFRFITSAGDASKVGGAKNALVYALVGLAIAALAQLLVHFVLHTANVATNPCKTNPTISADSSHCKP